MKNLRSTQMCKILSTIKCHSLIVILAFCSFNVCFAQNFNSPNDAELSVDKIEGQDYSNLAVVCDLTCPGDIVRTAALGKCSQEVTWTLPSLGTDCAGFSIVSSTHDPDDTFPVGTTTVTYTASDGTTDVTCSFDVTVVDNESPRISCPANITVSSDPTTCEAVVTWDTPNINDNCTGVSITSVTHNSGDTFPLGFTYVTYTVEDAYGNTANCTFYVHIIDVTDPKVLCPDNITVSNAAGQCGANATWDAPSTFDNCAGSSVPTATHNPGDFFPIGTTIVTYTIEDGAGNTAICSFSVTVEDTEDPVLTCPADMIISTSPGTCQGGTATWTTPSVTDNCSASITGSTHMSGDFFPLGTTTVTYNATDGSGNMVTCDFTVTVEDQEPPTLTCPADITLVANPGECDAVASWEMPIPSDNCVGVSLTSSSHDSGTMFPVGTTTVSYTATDAAGNTTDCSFTVTVEDNEDPVLTCPINVKVAASNNCDGVATWTIPVPEDNCAGAVITSASHTPGETFPIGSTTVTYTAMDASGNTTTCSFEVLIADTESPAILCPLDLVVSTDPGTCEAVVTWDLPEFVDNCPGTTITSASHTSGATFPLGTTTVSYEVTDASGNMAACSFDITVEDNEPPSVTCPADIVLSTVTGTCEAFATWDLPVPTDNCGSASISGSTHNSGDSFPLGTTTVTYTVVDDAGNEATCSFDITVEDNEPPVLVCPDDLIVYTTLGTCDAPAEWDTPVLGGGPGGPSLNDNCPGAMITSVSHNSGDTFQIGTTTVTYTATDAAGNTTTCEFDVTVEECPATGDIETETLVSDQDLFVGQNDTESFADNGTYIFTDPGTPANATLSNITLQLFFRVNGNSCESDIEVELTDPAGNVTVFSNIFNSCSGQGPLYQDILTVTNAAAAGGGNWVVRFRDTNDQNSGAEEYTVRFGRIIYDWQTGSGSCADPIIVNCPADVNMTAEPGFCGATVDVSIPEFGVDFTDCFDATITNNYTGTNDGTAFYPVGTTIVTWTVTDAQGNTATCLQTIIITDDEDPTVICPDDIDANNTPGLCGAIVSWPTPPQFDDNCTPVTITSTHNSGDTFPLGTTTVTYTAADPSGNTVSCSFDVTITDTEPPVLTCPEDVIVFTTPGTCDALAEWTVPDLTDNCPNPTITGSSHASGDTFPIGTTQVTYTAIDEAGNENTCTFNVIVEECTSESVTETVTIISDEDLFVGENDTQSFAGNGIYTFTDVGTSSDATLTNIRLQLFFRVFGNSCESDIAVRLTDPAGNVTNFTNIFNTCDGTGPLYQRTLVVTTAATTGNADDWVVEFRDTNDQNPGQREYSVRFGRLFYDATTGGDGCDDPVIVNCPADITGTNETGFCGRAFTIPVPQFGTDFTDCSSATIINDYTGTSDGSAFYPVGTTFVTWTVTDDQGNTATCIQTITVTDITLPVVTCPANVVIPTTSGLCTGIATWQTPTFFDNCSPATITSTHNSGDVFPIGTTTVSYTVFDPSGNSATCSFTVTVEDTEAPVLDCSLDPVRVADAGVCTFTMPGIGFDPTATDNCDNDLTFINGYNNAASLAGASFPVGVTTVTWTVTDDAGNSATCAIDIEILDEEAPTLDCSLINGTRSNDAGECSFTMPGIGFDPSYTDNCPGATASNDYNDASSLAGSNFPVGTTTVVWTVTDAAGNTATCEVDIVIEDTEDPVIDCSSINATASTDPGVCSYTVTGFEFDATFTDNCEGTLTNDYNSSASLAGATFPLGTTTVVWTVTDAAGNTASCSIDVVVEDNEAPVITCPENVTAFTTRGTCDAAATWDDPALADNCPGATITGSSHSSGDIFPIGTTTVTYTATDAAGNTVECSFDVTVEECAGTGEVETITLISDQDVYVGAGDMETFSENLPYIFPDSSPAGATITSATLQLFFRLAGNSCESDIEVQITDPAGNMNTFTGLFASCNGVAGGLYSTTINIPNASTNGGGQWTVEFRDNNDQNPVSAGILTPNNPAGTEYTVRFGRIVYNVMTGEDGCAIPIIVNCPAPVNAVSQSDICGAFVDIPVPQYGVDFTDCFAATIVNDFTGTSDASGLYPVGTTVVTWTVTDAQGNTATCLQIVTVVDNTPPMITCPADVTVSTSAGTCDGIGVWAEPTFSDNCPGPVVTSTHSSGATFPIGTTTVTYTITDLGGNSSTCSFTVTVEDNEDPVLTCPDDVTVFTRQGTCDAVAEWDAPTLTDNCPGATVTGSSHTSGDVFPIGTTTVTYTAVDAAGNTTECSFDVIVEECTGTGTSETVTLISDQDVFVGQSDTESFADNAAYTFTDTNTPSGSTLSNITLQLFFRVEGASCESEIEIQVTDPAGNSSVYGTLFPTCNGPGQLFIQTINIPSASIGAGAPADWTVEFRDTNDQNAGQEEYTVRFGRIIYDALIGGSGGCADPVIVNCPEDVTIDGVAGECFTQVDIPVPMFGTDFTDCFNATITNSFTGTSNGSGLYPVGTTYVTWTVTDEQGNTTTCVQTIVITDTGNPVVTCPNNIDAFTDPAVCGANVTWNPPVTDDNCGAIVVSNTHNPGDFFPVGTTTVTYVIADAAGNTTMCSFDVTVTDDEDPTIVCPDNVYVNFDAGSCDAVVTWGAATFNDNCAGATITNSSHSSGDTFPLGTTEVTIEVTDAAGNIATCSFDVTVRDNEAPVIINCPADIEIDGPPGECEASVTIPVPIFGTDFTDCQGTTMASNDYNTSSNASDTYPVGTTVVTWTFTDPSGNTVACQQSITVVEQNLETDAVLVTDKDVFVGAGVDNAGYNQSDSILIVDPGVPANATVTSVLLDFFFRPEGNSCERDVTVEVTDPAGNVSVFPAPVTSCTGNDAVFQFVLPVAAVPTAASGGGVWKLRFIDTQDQNPVSAGSPGAGAAAGTEYSVRFGRITYDITIDPDCDTAVPCASGGIITSFDETTICIDGQPDQLIFTRTSQLGANDGWLIIDNATGQILSPGVVAQGMNQFTSPDLDAAGTGVCTVYSIGWNGTLSNANQGDNIADIMSDDCFALSNPIDITREDCPALVAPGDVTLDNTITKQSQEMKLYPVPAIGILNVDYEAQGDEQLFIQIIDNSGRVLKIQEVTTHEGINTYNIDVNELLGGLYYIKVVDSKGVIQAKPFTKLTP